MENITERLEVSEEERDKYFQKCDTIESWLKEKLTEQEARAPHEDFIITSEDIHRKIREIETDTKWLIRRPKRKPPTPVNTTITEEDADASGEEEPVEPQEEKTGAKPEDKHDEL